jgi:hypothetical protein
LAENAALGAPAAEACGMAQAVAVELVIRVGDAGAARSPGHRPLPSVESGPSTDGGSLGLVGPSAAVARQGGGKRPATVAGSGRL